MATSLPASPYWQLRLGAEGEAVEGVDEIAQALRILLHTPPGSVPFDPEFGCDVLAWVDRLDAPGALPGIVRAISQAVARWEPRIKLRGVSLRRPSPGQAVATLTWVPASASDPSAQTTDVSLAASTSLDARYVPRAEVGVAAGVAPLDGSGLVPERFLPGSGHDFGEVQ